MGVNAAIYVASAVMAGSAYNADQNAKTQRKDAKKEVKRQEQAFANEEAAIAAEEQKDNMLKENAAVVRRQKAIRANKAGRSSTILTEPIGATGGASGAAPKTLLGA